MHALRIALLLSTLIPAALPLRGQVGDRITTPLHYLPYERGTSFNCWQSHNQEPTHNDRGNRYAIDFSPMAIGTPVLATCSGTVVWVKNDATGPTGKWQDNNGVCLQLEDGNVMEYLHFKHDGAVVELGQKVLRGDLLGYSGDTGSAMAPHLHIGLRLRGRLGVSIPFRFADVPGDGVPKRGTSYRSENLPLRTLSEWKLVEKVQRLYPFCRDAGCLEAIAPLIGKLTKLDAKKTSPELAPILKRRDSLLQKHEKAAAAALARIQSLRAENSEVPPLASLTLFAPADFDHTKSKAELSATLKELRKGKEFRQACARLSNRVSYRRLFKNALRTERDTLRKLRSSRKPPKKSSWNSTRRAWQRALKKAPEAARPVIEKHLENLGSPHANGER